MADILNSAISLSDHIRPEEYADLSMEFDRLVRQFDGQPYLKELALRAAKSVLCDLRYNQSVDVHNISALVLERYMYAVYEAEFQDRIPVPLEHHAGIDQASLLQRIKELQPHIEIGINKFAKDVISRQSIANLSLPRRSFRRAIDLDEDLLAG
jgi:hypothetical protein